MSEQESDGAPSSALAAAELRKAQAEARSAEAAARKAELEAAKLDAEMAEWNAAAEPRARNAETDAETKRLDNEQKRLANLTTQKAWVTDAVPDLTTVERGSTTGSDKALFTALLATRALNAAAADVAEQLRPALAGRGTLVLTTDETLLDRLAVHNAVGRQLEVLQRQIDATSTAVPRAPDEDDSGGSTSEAEAAGVVAAGAAAALAKILPGVLSLISANRTLTAADVSQDAFVTLLAVAGRLRTDAGIRPILLDETRLLPVGTAVEKQFALLELACHDLSVQLAQGATRTDPAFVAWAAAAGAVLELGQGGLTALSTVAAGAGFSPLMAAAAQSVFTDAAVSHVVVVRPAGCSTTQLVSDRPLAMKDPVHIVTTAAIAFAAIERTTSHLAAAGVATGQSTLTGKIGARFDVDVSQGTAP